MTTIHTLLDTLRAQATSPRDLGDKFERLMQAYLKADGEYQFREVWLWSEWEGHGNQPDTGIDLVAEDAQGEYCAIQCKCFESTHTLQKADIDSFFTASGKTPFSKRLIISTTDKWSKHAEAALDDQHIPAARLGLGHLADSRIDWTQFAWGQPATLTFKPRKQLRPHQQTALDKVAHGFQHADRGKLIMACGTGKTFTALKIAEHLAQQQRFFVLFLVPSISLLSQTLREWTNEVTLSMASFAVCSDTKVGKTQTEDIRVHDLAATATTDPPQLIKQLTQAKDRKPFTVIFSTYQSIQVLAEAQQQGMAAFDLIICDEAHRTTGVTLVDKTESKFVRVHDANYIHAHKRLYMTATPRLYDDSAKTKAQEANAELCSMDDARLYGEEFHRLGFAEAVSQQLLTDYKVMVLAVDEKYVSKAFQSQLADEDNELRLEDAVKITGCWNGLSKRMAYDVEGNLLAGDNAPMRRAVAFCQSIKASKLIKALFADIVREYHHTHSDDEHLLHCEIDHVDGTFNALERNKCLDWLKAETEGNTCRILSNARCLSEGVDVPALDAVMFLNPRNSVVDVVQSVGRVMRRAEGKHYGYIILPIGIAADTTPEAALKDNKKYQVVWQVLQALRAHDDRFNATVNKIELNQHAPDNIQVIGVTGKVKDDGGAPASGDSSGAVRDAAAGYTLPLFPQLEEWRNAIYAKIVQKCGQRRYWETWAKDIAQIAERHITRIQALLESQPQHRAEFDTFLTGLRNNLNPAISEADAIEMLAQHLITQPVFDALFEGYAFTQHNPVSQAMQAMLDLLHEQAMEKEAETLAKFYDSVKTRAQGIDNAEGKQKIIIELYDKFFRTAFPRMAERLGIVYTPVEVVDFILHSADYALRQAFGLGLTDKGVHVLDPFTGTGTFMTRLLQSGLIHSEDLARKYQSELHANELVLLAYYIAAVNIEAAYHGAVGGEYQPFNGIVLTDTFQMTEGKEGLQGWHDTMLPDNSERAKQQNQQTIQVIVGNPPYSVGQGNENDNNKNLKYPDLDASIRDTYAAHSTAILKNSLYDSYIRAIRWASNRIREKGVIGFITNGAFLEKNAADGLRKCLTDEFSSLYVFNLRGFIRGKSRDDAKREGQNIFNIMTGVAITILVKNPHDKQTTQLFYHDIGDYLSQNEKLSIVEKFVGIQGIQCENLTPNEAQDWINQRDESFDNFISLGSKKDKTEKVIFDVYSNGVKTNRDIWVYNFSQKRLAINIAQMIDFYNQQVSFYKVLQEDKKSNIDDFIDNNPEKISWSVKLKDDVKKLVKHKLKECFITSVYRPFSKQRLYFNGEFNDRRGQMPRIFPKSNLQNLAVCIVAPGARQDFSTLIVNCIPDLHLSSDGVQCFPLHTYQKIESQGDLLNTGADEYIKQDNIPDTTLTDFQTVYTDKTISKLDIFYYVYGILHSPEYKTRFAANLKKQLPRIPYAQDFWAFSRAGQELAEWHLNYETVEPYKLQETTADLTLEPKALYCVQKMQFAKHGKDKDKTTLIYNSHITLSGIPLQAYDYIVNGKPALEWIIERYQVTTDKASGIRNDPNDWSDDPRYIIDLVKRIVRVSLETVRIVNGLPALKEK